MGSWFKRNFLLVFFSIFALIGTGIGIGAVTVWMNTIQLNNEGVQTVGTVIDMVQSGKTQAPVVEFTLKNGETHQYTSGMYSSPPAYHVGEKLEISYDPANPDKVVLPGLDSWFAPAIMGFFFLVFGGVGYIGLVFQILKKRDINWLKTGGQAVQADFKGVTLNGNVKVNGSSPYVINAQWLDPATQKVYVFQSENIWFDPGQFIQGDKIQVLINPKNPGLYYIDLSFLPEQGN